jgi:hypothetical protein
MKTLVLDHYQKGIRSSFKQTFFKQFLQIFHILLFPSVCFQCFLSINLQCVHPLFIMRLMPLWKEKKKHFFHFAWSSFLNEILRNCKKRANTHPRAEKWSHFRVAVQEQDLDAVQCWAAAVLWDHQFRVLNAPLTAVRTAHGRMGTDLGQGNLIKGTVQRDGSGRK